MPYRRLPKTDQARYITLKKAVEYIADKRTSGNTIVAYATYEKVQSLYNHFATVLDQFRSQFTGRVDNSKQYNVAYKNVKMFLTHFIKVINMSIQRGELPKDIRVLYKLESYGSHIPPLIKDKDVLEIGKNIIDGEMKRIQNGGFPIYYPNVHKVKLHYDRFKELCLDNEFRKQNLHRLNTTIEELRKEIDAFIPLLWDQIEESYAHLPSEEKLAICQKCGIIYYTRKEENMINSRVAGFFKDLPYPDDDYQ